MVFIMVPPHRPDQPSDPRKARHDNTVGFRVVVLIMLGIAVVIFAVGPRSNNPPPLIVGWAVVGLAAIFGLLSFFSWMGEQGDGNESTSDNNSNEEQ